MAVAWPAWLPKPRRAAHSYQPDDVVVRSEFNGGPSRLRQMFSEAPYIFQIGFALKPGQWPMFEAFWKYDLGRGVEEVSLPVESGAGVVEHVCKFIGTPAYDASLGRGNAYVTATVEVVEPIEISEDLYDLVIDAYDGDPDAYGDFVDLFETYVNQTLPDSEMGD